MVAAAIPSRSDLVAYASRCRYLGDPEDLAHEIVVGLLTHTPGVDENGRPMLFRAAVDGMRRLIGRRKRLLEAMLEFPLDVPVSSLQPELSPAGIERAIEIEEYDERWDPMREWIGLSCRERQTRILESYRATGTTPPRLDGCA